MDFTRLRALGSLFSMLNQMVRNILLYNHQHADFPMQDCAATNQPLCHYSFFLYRVGLIGPAELCTMALH